MPASWSLFSINEDSAYRRRYRSQIMYGTDLFCARIPSGGWKLLAETNMHSGLSARIPSGRRKPVPVTSMDPWQQPSTHQIWDAEGRWLPSVIVFRDPVGIYHESRIKKRNLSILWIAELLCRRKISRQTLFCKHSANENFSEEGQFHKMWHILQKESLPACHPNKIFRRQEEAGVPRQDFLLYWNCLTISDGSL